MEALSFIDLVLLAGAICGFVALSRFKTLNEEVQRLREELEASRVPDATQTPTAVSTRTTSPAAAFDDPIQEAHTAMGSLADSSDEMPALSEPTWIQRIAERLKNDWMIWLGASCVSLAGVFLVRYSIDAGLLGPSARITMAIAFGISFHGFAEWIRRRSDKVSAPLAALAGAGSTILYAAFLTALRLYDLVSPGLAFAAMAAVALGTMLMARLHGPLLAAFGIIGAFLVPLLVATGDPNIPVLLVYATTISASALLLMRHVYRAWLWWGFAIGALFWGLAATLTPGTASEVTIYLTALVYLAAAVPSANWSLRQDLDLKLASYSPRSLWNNVSGQSRSQLLFHIFALAIVCIAILFDGDATDPWLTGLPFFIVTVLLARRLDHLYWLPWLALLTTSSAWIGSQLTTHDNAVAIEQISVTDGSKFLSFFLLQAILASALSFWTIGVTRRPAVFSSMATLAPAILLATAYVLIAQPSAEWNWGLGTAILALSYLAVAVATLRRSSVESLTVWTFISGHFLLALAAAIFWRDASLTLAMAAQLLSLAWIIKRFKLPQLGWLLKLVVSVVIARLTFNPWLPDYPSDVHWSLWTYGGSSVFAFAAAFALRNRPSLSAWVYAAGLHLSVLTVWAELRYQLYEGNVYAASFTLQEAVFLMLLTGSLALVYRYRLKYSENLKPFVAFYSWLLLSASSGIYLLILLRTAVSMPWVVDAVSATPFMNIGTAAFGGPVVILAALGLQSRDKVRRSVLAMAGISAWVFVSLQIRHLWTGTLSLSHPNLSNGELYTYSAVWLLMAVIALLGGAWRFGTDVYRSGMVLLAIVIAKLFFWDMSGLDGLLRVASFMGLGLVLLALSFLHQRLSTADR